MSTALRILGYEIRNLIRSRWVVGYALVFLGLSDALFRFGGAGGGERVLMSLTNVVLLLIPLVSVVLGTMHLYHAREFVELMLAQPVARRSLFAGLYGGLALPLALAFAVGVGVPAALHRFGGAGAGAFGVLLLVGVLLTFTFTALAFVVALRFQDRAVGLGVAIVLWLVMAVLWDGMILLGIALFSDWPVEKPVLAATLMNPVDLGRVLLLFRLDLSALSGYTGAVFSRFFAGGTGVLVSFGALLVWVMAPLVWGARRFRRKDF